MMHSGINAHRIIKHWLESVIGRNNIVGIVFETFGYKTLFVVGKYYLEELKYISYIRWVCWAA
jgi:hypothetical protein